MSMKNFGFRRLFLYLLIGSIAISALLGIGVLLLGDFGDIEVRVLMTALTVTVTSICGLACGACLEAGRGRYLPLAGIVFSVGAALMCFLIIWNVLDDSEVFIKSFLTATIFAISCSHLSLLSIARLDQKFSWSRIAAFVCVWLLAAIFLYIMWFEPVGNSDLIYRIIGVLGILVASITVITPILHKLSSGGNEIEKIDAEIARLKREIEDLEIKRASLSQPAE